MMLLFEKEWQTGWKMCILLYLFLLNGIEL